MKINDCISGFKVISKRESDELGGVLWGMIHVKTAARLLWLDNGEENKLFSIAFKTVPTDDTGVFHILEHSVLNGSEKYTVREPFVNLLKGSLNTFLNAMTYPDKTVYPVSSRNDKDFLNLCSVYLDAVFAPAIYKNPFIFMQEGWHYELAQKDAYPTYNGVVFNEMKGAYSSPDTLLNSGLMRLLYPDTAYKYESGGHPKAIPSLSYEQFIKTHKENYHPSNSYIYLDGDIELSSVLQLIDSYLSRYEKSESVPEIAMQKATPFADVTEKYDGSADDGAMSILGKIFADYSDRKKIIAMSIICDYLAGTNESPLKKAILDSSIAPEVSMYVAEELLQPFVAMQLRKVDLSRKDELRELIKSEIAKISKDGFNKERLAAMIDQVEFSFRDIDEPKALVRNVLALSSWLYGGDPLQTMVCTDVLNELRKDSERGYFESLLGELDFFGDGGAMFSLLPDENKAEEDKADEQNRLAAISAGWDEKKCADICKTCAELAAWQETEDSPEDIRTIPSLKKDELPKKPIITPTERDEISSRPVLWHKAKLGGISHYHLYFSLADCSKDELQALSLLTNLLGGLSTEDKSVAELEYEQKKLIGFLDYSIRFFDDIKDNESCRPYFVVTFSVLDKNSDAAIKLVKEILCKTDYDCENFSFLTEIILKQCRESLYQSIVESGNRFAFMRAASHYFAKDLLNDLTAGIEFYKYICGFIDDFDNAVGKFKDFVKSLVPRVFNALRLTVSLAGEKNEKAVSSVFEQFKSDSAPLEDNRIKMPTDKNPEKEFIVIPSPVSYAASCCVSESADAVSDGSLAVLSNILRFDYLWNEIRVKGGAYGCGFVTRKNGTLGFTTYRDPSPVASIGVFRRTPQFIKDFCREHQNIDTYLIGAVSSCEPLMHIREAAYTADVNYFSGITDDNLKEYRSRLLNTDSAALLRHAEQLSELSDKTSVCIIGSKNSAPNQSDDSWKIWKL